MIELNSYPTLLNDANLLAYYRFESNLTDSKSSLNWTNSWVTFSAWQFGNAWIFNWSSYFTLPTSTSFDATSMTINFVIKLNSATSWSAVIYDHWDETTWGGNYAWFSISHYTDWVNKFRTSVEISNWTPWNNTVNTVDYWVSDTNYHLLSITLSWTTTEIYFDNVLRSTKTNHSSVNYSTNPVIYVWCNHREFDLSNWNFLNWAIDDMSIFTRKLSSTELSNYYNWISPTIISTTAKTLVVWWGWGWWGWRAWWGWGWQVLYNTTVDLSVWTNTVTVWSWWTSWVFSTSKWGNWWTSSIWNRFSAWWWGWASENIWDLLWANWASGWGWLAPSYAWWTASAWYAWWTWWNTTNYCAWWGWWAGAVWVAGTSTVCWNWWAWVANSISWTSVTYAWGWGWGWNWWTPWTWWTGWGWNWQVTAWTAWWAWTANTGSGWGWWAWTVTRWVGWVGWSWIVIISYATNWSDWISNTSTGWTITTSWWQTIHTFTSSWTFILVTSWTSTTNSWFFMFF